jgi:hypothetical protein
MIQNKCRYQLLLILIVFQNAAASGSKHVSIGNQTEAEGVFDVTAAACSSNCKTAQSQFLHLQKQVAVLENVGYSHIMLLIIYY